MSKLLTFSKWLTCILAILSFDVWNIFEHALKYFFIIDDNYKLLIAS